MKFLIVLVALFACALAAPNAVEILKSSSDVEPEKWSWDVATSDGTAHSAVGNVKAGHDHEHDAIAVHGSYEWVDEKTGEHFKVTYVADENGYQPEGAHLPQLPKVVLA